MFRTWIEMSEQVRIETYRYHGLKCRGVETSVNHIRTMGASHWRNYPEQKPKPNLTVCTCSV